MSTAENPVIDGVIDPFVRQPGEPKRRHYGAWRFFEAAERGIALCGARTMGVPLAEPRASMLPPCQRCSEIHQELTDAGYRFRYGSYPGVPG